MGELMARKEARLFTSIWDDEKFIAAHEMEQRAYMFLISQPDMEHSGVLPLRPRRWARKGPSLSGDDWEALLEALERRQFIVVDRDTEEVLVRSLIRRDKIFEQPNVMRSATKHVATIESKPILRALAAEMHRIRGENPELTKGQDEALSEMQSALAERVGPYRPPAAENPTGDPPSHPPAKGSPNPSGNPSPNPSEEPSAMGSWGRGSVTEVSTDSPLPVPPAVPPPAGAASQAPRNGSALFEAPEGTEPPPNAGQLVAYWLEKCKKRPPGRVVAHMAKEIKNLLDEKIDPDDIRLALDDFLTKDLSPGNLPSLVNTVMNRRPVARADPGRQLVERDGLLLKPETIADIERTKRFEALEAERLAIGGPA